MRKKGKTVKIGKLTGYEIQYKKSEEKAIYTIVSRTPKKTAFIVVKFLGKEQIIVMNEEEYKYGVRVKIYMKGKNKVVANCYDEDGKVIELIGS